MMWVFQFTIKGMSEDVVYEWNNEKDCYVGDDGSEYNYVPFEATNIIEGLIR